MIGEKIMVVDDDQDFLGELDEILDCSGYCPILVSDPIGAVDAARALAPDLILLDLKMSGLSGYQVVDQLKKSVETSNIPIICMSGYFPVDEGGRLLDTGDVALFMKKPFGILELLNQIEAVLAVTRSECGESMAVVCSASSDEGGVANG